MRLLGMLHFLRDAPQRRKFDEAAFRGERFKDHPHDIKGNNDLLSLTQAEAIHEIHM